MIQPTVGRIVWFHDEQTSNPLARITGQPLAAIVTGVWGDRMVNLTVFDANGIPHAKTSVNLVQPEDGGPPTGVSMYCEWMPYQIGQAKATA